MEDRIILDLCGGTGSWSEPYRAAGYTVFVIDPAAGSGTVEELLLTLQNAEELAPVRGVLAAPPCTTFSGSGARHWPAHDATGKTAKGILVARACIDLIKLVKPQWWALENPVGRLRTLVPEVGAVRLTFDPSDYGDPYTKRTQLFGDFTIPTKTPVPATLKSAMHRLGPSETRAAERSVTPPGFARAFFLANP